METKAKALGLWGIGSNTKVSIAGNSLMIRIPKVLARAVGLAKGTAVKLRPAGKGRMLVESDV